MPPLELGRALPQTVISSASLYALARPSGAALLASGIEVPTWGDPAKLVPIASRPVSPLRSRPAELSSAEEKGVRSAFMASPVIASWCQAPRSCDAQRIAVLRTISFEKNVKLAELRLGERDAACDDALAHCAPLWFAIVAGGDARPVYQAARSGGEWAFALTPLAAADFDGDSAVEYLFWLDAYNENGFVLATREFQDQVVFSYGYH